jgi:ribonuclease HII
VKEIEEKLVQIEDVADPFFMEISGDDRKSVQQLLLKWNRRKEQKRLAEEKFNSMTYFERKVRKEGYNLIAGIDEVGRGPLAGPVVAAAVILPESFTLLGLDDSKKLTAKRREEYFDYIQEKATAIGIGIIEAEEIDTINIYEATKKAMLAAVRQLHTSPDFLLIDAMKLVTPYPSESIIKGDAKSISIAAASVIAKVTRDRIMVGLDEEYPQYHFAKNMGYGTQEHLEAIKKYGILPFHRKSFAPVKDHFVEMRE